MLDAITMQKPPIAAVPSPAPKAFEAQEQRREPSPVTPATFISPRMTFDSDAAVVITQYRDSSTGEVKAQFPSESVVQRYKQSDELEIGRDSAPKEPAPAAGTQASPGAVTGATGDLSGATSTGDTAPQQSVSQVA